MALLAAQPAGLAVEDLKRMLQQAGWAAAPRHAASCSAAHGALPGGATRGRSAAGLGCCCRRHPCTHQAHSATCLCCPHCCRS